ncbi:hypothetical protein [Roseococcus sp. YIM B11640]|uniref:hypothetical protein n=1 Tax=Roseococcus sp. YIM B11640 TaxID=3133973 RepID=UPI003C7ED229
MNFPRRILPAALLLAAAPVSAQPARGPNGGVLASEHGHVYELVISGTTATMFLMDGSQPMSSRGAQGRLMVQSGGQTSHVTLRAVAPNRLEGTLAAAPGAGARVVFTAQLGDGHRLQGRFVLE